MQKKIVVKKIKPRVFRPVGVRFVEHSDHISMIRVKPARSFQVNSQSPASAPQPPPTPDKYESEDDLDLTRDLSASTFKFYCYRCGQKIKVPTAWATKSINCLKCDTEIVIPLPPASEEK